MDISALSAKDFRNPQRRKYQRLWTKINKTERLLPAINKVQIIESTSPALSPLSKMSSFNFVNSLTVNASTVNAFVIMQQPMQQQQQQPMQQQRQQQHHQPPRPMQQQQQQQQHHHQQHFNYYSSESPSVATSYHHAPVMTPHVPVPTPVPVPTQDPVYSKFIRTTEPIDKHVGEALKEISGESENNFFGMTEHAIYGYVNDIHNQQANINHRNHAISTWQRLQNGRNRMTEGLMKYVAIKNNDVQELTRKQMATRERKTQIEREYKRVMSDLEESIQQDEELIGAIRHNSQILTLQVQDATNTVDRFGRLLMEARTNTSQEDYEMQE